MWYTLKFFSFNFLYEKSLQLIQQHEKKVVKNIIDAINNFIMFDN